MQWNSFFFPGLSFLAFFNPIMWNLSFYIIAGDFYNKETPKTQAREDSGKNNYFYCVILLILSCIKALPNPTDLPKAHGVLLLQRLPSHLLLPGQRRGGWEEGDGGGSAVLSGKAAAPFGSGPGVWDCKRQRNVVSNSHLKKKNKNVKTNGQFIWPGRSKNKHAYTSIPPHK